MLPLVVSLALGLLLVGLGLGRAVPDQTMLDVGVSLALTGSLALVALLVAWRAGWTRGPNARSTMVRSLDNPDRLVDLAPIRWPIGRYPVTTAMLGASVCGLGIVLGVVIVGGPALVPLTAGLIVLLSSVVIWWRSA